MISIFKAYSQCFLNLTGLIVAFKMSKQFRENAVFVCVLSGEGRFEG